MQKYSYESILRAVGRVLDLAEADSFAVRDTENGLLLEAFDTNTSPTVAVTLGVPELAQLLDWADAARGERPDPAVAAHTDAADEGALQRLLATRQPTREIAHETNHETNRERELVGTR